MCAAFTVGLTLCRQFEECGNIRRQLSGVIAIAVVISFTLNLCRRTLSRY
jgi:hypothetical protein